MHWFRPNEDTVQSLLFVNQGDEDFVFTEGREFCYQLSYCWLLKQKPVLCSSYSSQIS